MAKNGQVKEEKMPFGGGIFKSSIWEEIKDEITPQLYVTIRFIYKLLRDELRDETMSQPIVIKVENGCCGYEGRKDETDGMET